MWRARSALALVCLAAALAPAWAQAPPGRPGELSGEALSQAEQRLREALAAPNEEAFAQILVEARIVRADTLDTNLVYDVVVGFDPGRYRAPHLGAYPLTFEDQLIVWGRRISPFTNATPWRSGRFYLRDLASGREVWMWTEDTRRLQPPPPKPKGKPRKPVEAIAPRSAGTRIDLRTMGEWLRLVHEESRADVQRREREAATPRSSAPTDRR